MFTTKTQQRNIPQIPKERLFRLFHHVITEYSIPHQFYIVLLVIESIQILSFIIHPSYQSIWENDGIKLIQGIFSYISFYGIYQQAKEIGVIIFGLVFIIINAIAIGIILYDVYSNNIETVTEITTLQQRRVSGLKLKYLQYLFILYKTILIMPIFSLPIGWISSTDSSTQQNQAASIIAVFITIVAFISSLILLIIFLWICFDKSPFSKLPISGNLSQSQAYKNVSKIVLSIFAIVIEGAQQISNFGLFNIFLTIVFAYIMFQSYNKVYTQNVDWFIVLTNKIYVFCNLNLLWLSFCVLINQLLSPSNNSLSFIFIGIGLVFINVLWIQVKKMHQHSLIFDEMQDLGDPTAILNYYLYCISYIHSLKHNPESYIYLKGILNLHIQNLKKYEMFCTCTQIRKKLRELLNDQTDGYKIQLSKVSQVNLTGSTLRNKKRQEQQLWYQFIKNSIYQKIQTQNLHNEDLLLLLSYLEKTIFSNNFKAYRCIEKCQFSGINHTKILDKLPIKTQFLIYRQKRDVQQIMKEQDVRINQKNLININKFYEFELGLNQLVCMIKQSALQHLQFWINQQKRIKRCLLDTIDQSYKLRLSINKIRDKFQKLSEMNPKNVLVLQFYSIYRKYILNDPKTFIKNKQKIKKLEEQILRAPKYATGQLQKDKYSNNSNTVIIIISCNRATLGIVKNCTEKITQVYGYSSYEIIGQSINTIMPTSIANVHNDILLKFFERGKSNLGNIERIGPIINKNGFLVVSQVLFKNIANLLNGIQMVGIMSQIKEFHPKHDLQRPKYLFHRLDTDKIQGVSQNFFKDYGHRIQNVSQYSQVKEQLYFKNLIKLQKDYRTQKFIQDIEDTTKGAQAKICLKKSKFEQKIRIYQKCNVLIYGLQFKILMVFSERNRTEKNIANSNFEEIQNDYILNDNQEGVDDKISKKIDPQKCKSNKIHASIQKNLKNKNDEPSSKIKCVKLFIFLQLLIIFIVIGLQLGLKFYFLSVQSMMINFYNENSLLTQDIIDLTYFSRLLQVSAKGQNHLDFIQIRNNITQISKSLQKHEFQLVNNEGKLYNIGFTPVNTVQMIYNWQIKENGQIQSNNQTISLTVFDTVTSSSSLNTAEQDQMKFNYQLRDSESVDFKKTTLKNLFHIRYTSLYELIPKKLKYQQKIYEYYVQYGKQVGMNKSYIFISISVYSLVIIIVFAFYVAKYLNHLKSMALLFELVKKPQFSYSISVCSSFLSIYFSSSYQIFLKSKSALNKIGSFDNSNYLSHKGSKLLYTKTYQKDQGQFSNNLLNSPSNRQIEAGIKKSFTQSMNIITEHQISRRQTKLCQKFQEDDESPLIDSTAEVYGFNVKQYNWIKRKIILLFTLFICFLTFGFLLLYLVDSDYRRFEKGLQNRKTISDNIIYLKGVRVLALQSALDDNKFVSYPSLSSTYQNYTQKIYKAQRQYDSIAQNGQAALALGKFIFKTNTHNVCNNQFTNDSLIFPIESFSEKQCRNLENRILTRGLRISIINYIEKTLKTIKSTQKYNIVNSTLLLDFLKLQKYIQNSLLLSSQILQKQCTEKQDQSLQMTGILLGIFIPLAIISAFFIYKWISSIMMKKMYGSLQLISEIPVGFIDSREKQFEGVDSYISEIFK